MLDRSETNEISHLGGLLQSVAEQAQTHQTWLNGQPFEQFATQLSELKNSYGSVGVGKSHTLSSEGVVFERWQIEAAGRNWPLGYLMDTDRSECFVQLDIDLLLKAAKGASYSVGRPNGSVVSPVAAAGIKAAARFLRPPQSVLSLENSEQNREVVRLYIEEFKNNQNFGIFPRLFSHRFSHHFDHDGLKGDMRSWVMTGQDFLRGFPNVQVEIRHLLAEGDYVLEHNLATGDHRGVFRGKKVTNRKTTWPEMHLYRLKDQQIVENWPMVSFSHIVSQLTKA